ncbi:MAG: type II toxin-antitoxin system VapC family toxin [Nitrososphaerales archaeon]
MYVIDSFAWIEYFTGSKTGESAIQYIESEESVTPTIVIAELSAKYAGLKQDFAPRLKFIALKSRIVGLDEETATLAGVISSERKSKIHKWGLADSIILATARLQEAEVVTGDQHFSDLKEAIMIH